MRILVISHTEHYSDANGNVVGWGATVKELNALADAFGEVVHIACLHKKNIPPSALSYQANVRFVPIQPFGGKGLLNKLSIITTAIQNLRIINRELKQADIFQFRAPTSIGLYIIPYLSFFSKKKGWYKYAGNWVQKNPPLSYRLQKWMLLRLQKRKVTINGSWNNQPVHCVSFENPCITNEERQIGIAITNRRTFSKPLKLCFVGRLDAEKGIYEILDAIKNFLHKTIFDSLEIAGDGPEFDKLTLKATTSGIPVKVYGALSHDSLIEIYKKCDFILLPSKSEGFPKVIAEAANFGCIPIVSDVSAIGQYINDSNGFLWNPYIESFTDFFKKLSFDDRQKLQTMSLHAHEMATMFTYDAYIEKLRKHILVDN